jgi:hypothetical protein
MRKLKEEEVKSIKKQLGGDVEVYQSTYSSDPGGPATADARVPSLDALRGSSSSDSKSALESDAGSGSGRKRKAATRGSNPGKSDYSVRFNKKNADKGSKVAIVSSKLNKVVYEQG